MCRDRLHEFRSKAGLPTEITVQYDAEANSVDLGINDVSNSERLCVDPNELFKLLEKLGPLYANMQDLHEDIQKLKAGIHNHNNREKFDDQVICIKRQLHAIKKGIDEFRSEYKDNEDLLLAHICRTHVLSLSCWSTEELHELSALVVIANERHRAYVRKEMQITAGYDKDITEEELQSLLDKPPTMFSQDLLTETKQAKQMLTEIRERHDQVIKLEKSIVELNQMFQDLALLVRTQGESVDRIEGHLYEASTRTAEAAQQMQEARVKAQSAMKKKYICYVVLSSAVIIFIVLLVYSLT